MAIVVAGDLGDVVTITRGIERQLRLAARDAVNESALAVTTDARNLVKAMLGPEQRMSRVTTRKRNDKGGRTTKVSASTLAQGGTKINPAYKQADSDTNPVAIIGARGPAHLIEHRRRGGYTVKPARGILTAAQAAPLSDLEAQLFGAQRAAERRSSERLPHAPALPMGGDVYRGSAKPGPISTPRAPITRAFARARTTIANRARDAAAKSLERRMGKV